MAERRVCAVNGCEKPVSQQGWCAAHVSRWKRHGDPLGGGPFRIRNAGAACSVAGCDRAATGRGLCHKHRLRLWRHGDPSISLNPVGERPEKCSVNGCDRKHHAKGYCSEHAYRFTKHGDPLAGKPANPPPGEPRMWLEGHVDHDGADCLIWPFGEPIKIDGINWRAARYMCALAHGPAPSPGLHAAHSCGRGDDGCVHPAHLRWATPAENEADKVLHGTRVQGEAVHLAKLTDTQVREIRALKGKMIQWDIARRYGVAQSTVWAILARRNWKHVL